MTTARGGAAVAGDTTAYPDERRHEDGHGLWVDRTRVVLTPLAAPSILGLFGFFTATVMVGTNLAGWWGNAQSPMILWPFALMAGGVAQFLAGMWAYRARDGVATAMHGIWGSFWLGYGVLWLLIATHVLPMTPLGKSNIALAMWFVALCAITGSGALASLGDSLGITSVLVPLAAGSGLFAVGLWGGWVTIDRIAGWLFVASAAAAWYVASAMMLAGATGRTILPLGKYSKAANVPMRRPMAPIEYEHGEPGVKAGQ
ncbi:MAG TPA: GPR1/FUN34/YaaH family transporter [Mycobacterium sp.]|nr:GPR1/FUN34/YaaH family transporter [Mycobacterium sp.]